MRLIIIAMVATFIGSTGFSFADSPVSDQMLQKRAAFAFGVKNEDVTIKNVETDGMRIEFTAQVKGKEISCYVVGANGIVSDAVCAGQSNALLDAAKSF